MTSTSDGPGGRPRWLVPAFIAATCVLAVVVIVFAWVVGGPPRDMVALVVLGLLSIASWAVRVPLLARVSVAAGSIISLASLVIVGPFATALVSGVSMALEIGHRPVRVRVFNAAMSALCGAVGGLTYLLAGGPQDIDVLTGPVPLLVRVGLPLMVANLVQSLLNFTLLGGIVWADRGTSYRRFVQSMLLTSGLAQIGYGVIGFLFVLLWEPARVGPFSAVLILMPLFVARWAFVQYGDEQRAHEQTVAALVAAVEIRDPYAAGHSERVARLSEQIGEQLGLGGGAITTLRYAALLHDIGLVGIPFTRAASPIEDPAVVRALVGHPEAAAALVADIDFLAASAPGIRHHHERVDGRGYPAGLVGEEIPLDARIIAVADAFDSLTRGHARRAPLRSAAALGVVRARCDSHLDAAVCDALERVVERQPWPAPADLPEGTSPTRVPTSPADSLGEEGDEVLPDHDDPHTGDEVVLAWRGVGRPRR